MTWQIALAVLGLGLVSGVVAGMFGVGGASITTPGVRALGATPIEAVGSTVPAILPGAISGSIRYARSGLIDWRTGLTCGLSGSVAAICGAWIADNVNPHYLMIATASIVGWSGISMLRVRVPAPSDDRTDMGTGDGDVPELVMIGAAGNRGYRRPPFAQLTGVGIAAGLLAGLLGVGGGVVMVPAFTKVLRIPIKPAVATSLVSVAIFSVPSLAMHALMDNVNWSYAMVLTAGVVPGAQIGSRFTIGIGERAVRLLFGVFLVVVAVIYAVSEARAL